MASPKLDNNLHWKCILKDCDMYIFKICIVLLYTIAVFRFGHTHAYSLNCNKIKYNQPANTETGCLYLPRMRNTLLSSNVKDLLPGQLLEAGALYQQAL